MGLAAHVVGSCDLWCPRKQSKIALSIRQESPQQHQVECGWVRGTLNPRRETLNPRPAYLAHAGTLAAMSICLKKRWWADQKRPWTFLSLGWASTIFQIWKRTAKAASKKMETHSKTLPTAVRNTSTATLVPALSPHPAFPHQVPEHGAAVVPAGSGPRGRAYSDLGGER